LDKRNQIMLNILLSLAFFAAIIYLVGFGKIYSVLRTARLEMFALALLAYVSVTLIMSYRLKTVLASMGERLGMRQVAPSNLAGLLSSDFTPARMGYFFTAFSLSSRFSIKLEKTIAAIFGPQLFDFMVKVASAAILSALIISRAGASGIMINVIVIAVASGAIIFAGLLVFHPPALALLSPFESLPLAPKAFGFLRRMHEHSASVLSVKWQVIWISLLAWLMKGVEWLLLSRAIGISVTGDMVYDLLFMMVFQGAITIIQFVPGPTIAGAGASEAAFAVVLLPFGVPFETSVAFGFLTRLTMIVVDVFSLPVIVEYLHKHSMEKTLDKLSSLKGE